MSSVGKVNEKEYNDSFVPVITISNRSNTQVILEHNVLEGNTTQFSPFELVVSGGIKQTSTFTIRCFDDFGYLRSGLIPYRGRVHIKAKKPWQTTYFNLLKGLILDINKTEFYKDGNEIWEITGQSMKHIWTHTYIQYVKNIPFLNLKENQLNLKNNDKKFHVGNIVHDILTRRDIFPNNNGYNILERGGFTDNGVDRTIPLTIPSTDFTGTVQSLLDQMSENAGCICGDDEDGDIFFRYPVYKSSGHIIKTQTDVNTDNPDVTAYTSDEITVSTSTDPSVYAEVIIGQADQSSIVSNNSSTNNYTSLFDKDIGVRFDIRSTEAYDLTFILSKVNAGTDSPNPENTNLRGFIANDVDGRIGTDVVAEITIPLREIPATPEPIARRNIKWKRPINPTSKYWLVLQEIGSSEDNTVLWWHDDGELAFSGVETLSAIRDVEFGRSQKDAYIPQGWTYINNAQVYSHTFTLRAPILHVSNTLFNTNDIDPAPVEIITSPTGVSDSASMNQYMAIFGENAARIVKAYDFGEVSIPNIPIRPGMSVVYIDTRGMQHSVNITDIEYTFNMDMGVFGTSKCVLAGVGYISPAAGDSLGGEDDFSSFYCY